MLVVYTQSFKAAVRWPLRISHHANTARMFRLHRHCGVVVHRGTCLEFLQSLIVSRRIGRWDLSSRGESFDYALNLSHLAQSATVRMQAHQFALVRKRGETCAALTYRRRFMMCVFEKFAPRNARARFLVALAFDLHFMLSLAPVFLIQLHSKIASY
jgi:hypothetical protein